MFVPSKNLSPLVGLVNATTGSELLIVIVTTAEVLLACQLSVATAVKVNCPRGALLQTIVYGGPVTSPSLFAPSKNSTRVMNPSLSTACACTKTSTGVKSTCPLVGLRR